MRALSPRCKRGFLRCAAARNQNTLWREGDREWLYVAREARLRDDAADARMGEARNGAPAARWGRFPGERLFCGRRLFGGTLSGGFVYPSTLGLSQCKYSTFSLSCKCARRGAGGMWMRCLGATRMLAERNLP